MARRKNAGRGRVEIPYLQYLVADAKPAILVSCTLRIETADEHRHSISILVSRQRDAQSPSVLLEGDHQHFVPEMLILLLYLDCKIKRRRSRVWWRSIDYQTNMPSNAHTWILRM